MTGEDQVIVEDVTYMFFSVPNNMENSSTQKNNYFLQAVLYFL